MPFDPDKYLNKQPAAAGGFDPDAYLHKKEAFDPDKYLSATPPQQPAISPPPSRVLPGSETPGSAAPDSPEYEGMRQEMDRGLVDSVTKSPGLVSQDITDEDLATIAKKHGVDSGKLREFAPLLGASLKDPSWTEQRRRLLGMAGQTIAFGAPQKLMRMAQEPAMERALDDVTQLASARKSLLLSAGEIAVPGGAIGKLGKGVAGTLAGASATGAIYGASASRQGEEIPGAIGGAIVGAGLGAAATGIGKAFSKRAAKAAEKVAEDVPNAERMGGADLQEQIIGRVKEYQDADALISDAVLGRSLDPEEAGYIVGKYAPGTKPEQVVEVAEDIVRSSAQRVASEFGLNTAGDAPMAVQKWAGIGEKSGQGSEYAHERIRKSLAQKHILDVFEEQGVFSADNGNIMSRAADFLSDAQYVLRAADEKLPGLGIEDAHQQINRGLNRASFAREDFRKQIGGIFNRLQKEGKDDSARFASRLIGKVEKAGEGETPILTSDEEAVYAPFRKFFSEGLQKLDALAKEYNLPALEIKARDNYIPAQLLDPHQLDMVLQQRVSSLLGDINQASGRAYKDIAQVPKDLYNRVLDQVPDHKDTMRFIRMISGEDSDNLGAVSQAIKRTFINPETHGRLETLAKAALERDDLLPIWARETNLYRLADKWANNSVRHLFLRQGLDQMNRAADILGHKKLGFEKESKYIRNLLADINGVRRGTMAAFTTRAADRWLKWADRKISTASSAAEREKWETVRSLPMALQALGRNVHSNLLGANARTLIMNLTQTMTKTLPEFGTQYGGSLMLRGAMSLGRGRGLRGLPAAIQEMQAMGLVPAKYVGGSLPYMAEGVSRRRPFRLLSGAANKSSEIIMKPFELAEMANRGIAFRASQVFVDDLSRGSKHALRSLSAMPTAVQRSVQAALVAGDREAALKAAATHIINSTQYQYNRASMSEYGRTMGPLFSVFSKWPTATLGQLVESYRTKGLPGAVRDNTHKLIAPLLLLEAADQAYLLATGSDEFSDREAKFVSRSGISQAAPIGNLVGIAKGDFFTPPAVDIAMKAFVKPVLSGQYDSLGDSVLKGTQESLYQFSPGAAGGWIRFLTDDVVTMVEGERPEGGFVEKAVGVLK